MGVYCGEAPAYRGNGQHPSRFGRHLWKVILALDCSSRGVYRLLTGGTRKAKMQRWIARLLKLYETHPELCYRPQKWDEMWCRYTHHLPKDHWIEGFHPPT